MFSTSGGLGPAAKSFYKRLAPLIAEKHDQPYKPNPLLASCQIELFVVIMAQDPHTIKAHAPH